MHQQHGVFLIYLVGKRPLMLNERTGEFQKSAFIATPTGHNIKKSILRVYVTVANLKKIKNLSSSILPPHTSEVCTEWCRVGMKEATVFRVKVGELDLTLYLLIQDDTWFSQCYFLLISVAAHPYK